MTSAIYNTIVASVWLAWWHFGQGNELSVFFAGIHVGILIATMVVVFALRRST